MRLLLQTHMLFGGDAMDESETQWTSCCRGRKCCPSVAVVDGFLLVKDDDGNVIKITRDQLRDILQTVSELGPSELSRLAILPHA